MWISLIYVQVQSGNAILEVSKKSNSFFSYVILYKNIAQCITRRVLQLLYSDEYVTMTRAIKKRFSSRLFRKRQKDDSSRPYKYFKLLQLP